MPHTDLKTLRTQLISRGYRILPNRGKVPIVKSWNSPAFIASELSDSGKGSAAQKVAQWEKRFPDALSTGLLIMDGQVVIDVDVDDREMVSILLEGLPEDVMNRAPTRYGKGEKCAVFCRLAADEEPFVRLASRAFGAHRVEVFGGKRLRNSNISRQFGIYGPHSYNDDGTVALEYTWAEGVPALHETSAVDLPEITVAQVHALIDRFEQTARELGWQETVGPATEAATAAYDITDATRFDTDRAGRDLSYAELCEAYAACGDLRCASNFIEGRSGTGTSRCWVFWSPRHDCVAVFVYGDEVTHYPADYAPDHDDKIRDAHLAEIAAPLAESPVEPPPPDAAAGLNEKTAWLVATRGYLESEDRVVALYATALDCRTRPEAFARRYRAWFEAQGNRKKPLFATDLWEMTPHRQNLDGVRMRPDRPFPLYSEDGRLFKNSYRRPAHAVGGRLDPFLSFIKRFIPDPVEREWLLDWMAHKQARPEIPGTAVIFVADTEEGIREGNFGTGRGLMFKIAHRLYGEAYATTQSFSMLEGSSSQSTFNDWMHGSVLVTVDEAKTSPTAHRRGERNAAYEVLKDIVDPAPKRFSFKGKYRQAFDGMSYCSFWVASNHADALAIPENDRRFSVLRNGRPIVREEAVEIVAWMDDPANIGALAGWLADRDLSAFNMFEPLVTLGKAEMAELARSDVEEMLRDLMADPSRGLAFTKEHIESLIEHNHNGSGQYWRGEFKAAWHVYCVGLKLPGGGPRRIAVHGTQRKLFTFRDRRKRVEHLPAAALRREVSKWGGVEIPKELTEIVGPKQKIH
jgi:hypothetical protein